MTGNYPKNNLMSGFGYFVQGVRLIWHPQLRPFILVPLIVNVVLFLVLTGALVHYLDQLMGDSFENLSPWLKPLAGIFWFVVGVLLLIIYGYSFNLITNIIAAPFYGLLAEKAEQLLTGKVVESEPLTQMIPRVMAREFQKLLYFIFRGLLVILIIVLVGTIPVVNVLAPAIGLAWGAWCMSIQYVDYQADNHRTPFTVLRKKLWKRPFSSLGLGGTVMGCSVIPVINIFAMPAAVTAGTLYWLSELQECEVQHAYYQ